MSANNRPVCSYTTDFEIRGPDGEVVDVFAAECPMPPVFVVLEKVDGEWRRAMQDGEFQYACEFCGGVISKEHGDDVALARLIPVP